MRDTVQAVLQSDDSMTPTPPLDDYLAAEAQDSNLFWRLDSGHHQNLLDEAVERMQAAEAMIMKAEGS